MSKSEERRIAAMTEEETVSGELKKEFFFPPQDGRDAFMCEAKDQEEADALYAAASEK